ncbi:hypothetical protein ASF49_03945 [Methylobacterium sp. Leaf104]|uniref:polysaccharide biosynthesis tyrosine autokinase n=1 Tax=Methylobacterium TaxID=407 RepID=UPI000700A33E|nr:polysaccharide biosynthesis tyrosine autokinase [Methylobacterium sp. Leaf104]KQP38182.1 hypothetical protein ASF49_03945 [Methylobacterium sp. Leaf104]MCI9880442.1 polysaccharide biosynthesis tyrosine autokinase [Methylobacterium goesingense]
MLKQTPTELLDDRRAGAMSDAIAAREVDMVAFLQRYRWTILAFVLLAVVAAAVYIHQTTVLYQARAQIIVDPRMPQIPTRDQTPEIAASMDAALVESQMIVMRSETIATAVVETLRIEELPKEVGLRAKLKAHVLRWLDYPPPSPPTPYERMRDAIGMIENGLSVRRLGTSYAFEIAFTSPSAERSAQIVNAIADAYVRDQLDSRSEAARQGSAWLEGRIQQLRREMNAASRLVQEFKASHDYRIPTRKSSDASNGTKPANLLDPDESITLEELETASQTSRRIYESFLQAFADSVQRQSFPIAGARVITQATRPLMPSHPRTILILALAILLGGVCGIICAIVRQGRDSSISNARQMMANPGHIGTVELPHIGSVSGDPSRLRKLRRKPGAAFVEVLLAPFSEFSDELRRVKAFAMHRRSRGTAQIIGVVSCAEGEGRSTIVSNLAALFAYSSARTLVIDADIRDSALTHRFAPRADKGLVEVLLGGEGLAGVVQRTQIPKLDILPAPKRTLIAHSSDLLGSGQMQQVLEEARRTYDAVILDLPPTNHVADALILSPMLDGVILVARSGVTQRRTFGDLSAHFEAAQVDILALVLNMVPRRRARHARSLAAEQTGQADLFHGVQNS